jgi:ABC-type nickel/cobalt efflux system permease component RcnA
MNGHAFHTFVGTSAPATAVLISFSEVEAWLRVLSLVLGICIGAVSLYKMLKAKKP